LTTKILIIVARPVSRRRPAPGSFHAPRCDEPKCRRISSIPAPLPGLRHRPALAVDRPGGEPFEPQALADDFRDHHAADRAAEAFVQAETEVELVAQPARRVELVGMRQRLWIEH